jgi:nucleotide-binding universal stress UspA family protein
MRYAQELAEKFDAELYLIHVVALPTFYPMGAELSTAPMPELIAEAKASARQTLEAVAHGLTLPGNRVRVDVVTGTPVSEILDTIAHEEIDLVVMGTHGRGMVEHLFLGSVAERVVRRSPVPVLTMHSAEAAARIRQETLAAEAVR